MANKTNFNMDKLPDYIETFKDKSVAVVGAGAVGSYQIEMLAKMGVSRIYTFDFDPFEAENIVKSSCLYRLPEDVGRNKAVAIAERVKMINGSKDIHGINADITCFGPMAFAGFDIVILALDNYAAKVYFNQIWKQIPKSKRPVLIFGGTKEENAQSNCLDGEDACLRCLLSEDWLEYMLHRTSCSGPQYRLVNGVLEIVKTTGLASRICSDLMSEQCRSIFLGLEDVVNTRIVYNPYPVMAIGKYTPMARADCPDCRNFHSVENAEVLKGMDVLHTTVKELLDHFKEVYESEDFEVSVPVIEFAKIAYGGLIVDDYCRACGQKMTGVYRHEFRTPESYMLCDKCREAGMQPAEGATKGRTGTIIRAITHDNCDEALGKKTLFEVGFTLGGFIGVIRRNKECLDILDKDSFVNNLYYCENDRIQLDTITELGV